MTICHSNKFRQADMQVLTLNTVDHFGHTGAEETRCKHQDSIYRAVSHNAIALVCFNLF